MIALALTEAANDPIGWPAAVVLVALFAFAGWAIWCLAKMETSADRAHEAVLKEILRDSGPTWTSETKTSPGPKQSP